ncbi:MAG: CehA/McbA family metallohydrolase [bacterium]
MGRMPHLSRREILRSISILGSGSLLAPIGTLRGGVPESRPTGVIRGALRDSVTGQPIAAKIRVTSGGAEYLPATAIRTMPRQTRAGAKHFFYARGAYELAVPPGRYDIEVVRGICHETASAAVEVGAGLTRVADFAVPVLWDLQASGWYSGNTHTHYHLDLEEEPDDRLRLVPPAEALDVSVLSYLIRNDSPYISNRYPVGRLLEFSRDGTLVDMGEEARNNSTAWGTGYGLCLFLNIPRLIEPVSTGVLSRDGKAPDFPTLSMLAAEAKKIGGTTIWCHNGSGMEMATAIALGNIDAFNLADGQEASYERYYRLLNCGVRLPASTGTDWWIYDHNRVFVQVEGPFSYEAWIAGLRTGRTFVSNGPLLSLTVEGQGPGAVLEASQRLRVVARAVSRLPFDRLELVHDGAVVADSSARAQRETKLEIEIPVERSGWVAARVASQSKTHAGYTIFAHTSPVYFRIKGTLARRAEAAGAFVDEIEASVRFIRKSYRFASEADRALALGRFEQGREFYARLVRS